VLLDELSLTGRDFLEAITYCNMTKLS